MKQNQLNALAQISEAVFHSERTKLAQLKAKEAAVAAQLADLQTARTQSGMAQQGAAYRAGADVLWQTWVDQRREVLNAALAKLRAAQLIQQDTLRQAFGRREATAALVKRHDALCKQQRQRRADQIS